jgi:hypothetical protein
MGGDGAEGKNPRQGSETNKKKSGAAERTRERQRELNGRRHFGVAGGGEREREKERERER